MRMTRHVYPSSTFQFDRLAKLAPDIGVTTEAQVANPDAEAPEMYGIQFAVQTEQGLETYVFVIDADGKAALTAQMHGGITIAR